MKQSFWWVNHRQTFKQELDGGYLWSPKTEANGSRSQFYENMRKASPGDVVISYANGNIGFAGVVSDFAISSPKPTEFGNIGLNWNAVGWLLPVTWKKLEVPVKPKSILSDISKQLPSKYSPINPATGGGYQKAYLAEIGRAVFDAIAKASNLSASELPHPSSAVASFVEQQEAAVQLAIENDGALSSTEKDQIVKARKGQGQFRNSLSQMEKCCRVTGVRNPALLIASHMKPWRSCDSAKERLDGNNGLLLSPHVDLLFDRGLITFSDQGQLSISPRLDETDLKLLGLERICKIPIVPFTELQRPYLDYHRRIVFLPLLENDREGKDR